jgi:glycerol-3-phosphate acyltransferase PlsY
LIIGLFFAVITIGYLLGAIPFGLVVGRLRSGIDIRDYGSGKTGLANLTRTTGKKAGAIVFVLDIGKGAVVSAIARVIINESASIEYAAMGAAVIAATVGHCWPVYTRFRGGRGVSVFMGGLLATYWPVGLACDFIFWVFLYFSRYFSVASMISVSFSIWISLALVFLNGLPIEILIFSIVGTILIVFKHRDNIKRLVEGTERKIGTKADPKKRDISNK